MNVVITRCTKKGGCQRAWSEFLLLTLLRLWPTALFLPVSFARGQDSQFTYDLHGDLAAQTAAAFSLPQILANPQQQVVRPGELASFFVVAADTRGLSYHWLFNGTNLPGAGSDALLITNVNVANQGPYSAILSNASGSITSTVAQLYIDTRGVGMPDSWQLAYFGNLNQNPTDDFDNDGVSNLQEFLDGTNPTNSALARFRLIIVNAGAFVNESPTRLSYTNGEVVTLTATAFAPYSFRGWAGDIVTTNNPATITMSTNKTVIAYGGPFNITWTNSVSGDWNTAANWFPNLVPGSNDNVIVNNNVTITVNGLADCASLTLNASGSLPVISGSGTLTLHADSTFATGSMTGNGRAVILPGVTVNVSSVSSFFLSARTLENGGTLNWTGNGSISMDTGAVITNRAGALFNAQDSASLGGSGTRIDNAGTFRKSVSAGTTTVFATFNNYGTVDLHTGTLQFSGNFLNSGSVGLAAGTTNWISGGGSASGTFTATATALVEWTGSPFTPAFNLNPGAQLNGAGLYRIDGTTVNFNTDVALQNLDLVTVLGSGYNALNGSGNVTISNVMNWLAGSVNGSGSALIAPGATLNLANPYTLYLYRNLENGGTILWTGAGDFYLSGVVLTNRAGALFQAQNAASLSGGGSRFDNAGTFRKSVSPGTVTLSGATLNNYATVDIQSGILAANNGYVSSPNALLNCALGGTAAGTNYGQLQVAGAVTLNGASSVVRANGYVPATGDSFTVLTAGTRNGTFANFYYPSNAVTMQLTNTPNSVIVRVTAVAVSPSPPLLLPPLLSGTNVLFTWTAISNITYRLEFNPDLTSSNWTAVPGDVLGLTNTARKPDALTSSNRFYRVLALP